MQYDLKLQLDIKTEVHIILNQPVMRQNNANVNELLNS